MAQFRLFVHDERRCCILALYFQCIVIILFKTGFVYKMKYSFKWAADNQDSPHVSGLRIHFPFEFRGIGMQQRKRTIANHI